MAVIRLGPVTTHKIEKRVPGYFGATFFWFFVHFLFRTFNFYWLTLRIALRVGRNPSRECENFLDTIEMKNFCLGGEIWGSTNVCFKIL